MFDQNSNYRETFLKDTFAPSALFQSLRDICRLRSPRPGSAMHSAMRVRLRTRALQRRGGLMLRISLHTPCLVPCVQRTTLRVFRASPALLSSGILGVPAKDACAYTTEILTRTRVHTYARVYVCLCVCARVEPRIACAHSTGALRHGVSFDSCAFQFSI